MYFEWGTYLDDWRKIQKELNAMEQIPPKNYGELLAKRRKRKKKKGGK